MRSLVNLKFVIDTKRRGHISSNFRKNGFFSPSSTYLKDKTMPELLRGLLVFQCCKFETFVKYAEKIYSTFQKYFGRALAHKLLKDTFYGQFVAGHNFETLRATSKVLLEKRVKAMLCPPMEDLDSSENSNNAKILTADRNADRYLEYLNIAARLNEINSTNTTVMQLKPSSIFSVRCLDEFSSLIKTSKDYDSFCSDLGEHIQRGSECKVFQRLTSESRHSLNVGLVFYKKLFDQAESLKIPIFVDGELSSSTDAILVLNLALQLTHKLDDFEQPFIFSTIQNYLKDSNEYIQRCLDFSSRNKLCLGLKMVRGAYLLTERSRASQMGHKDPVFGTYEETCRNYDQNVSDLISNIRQRPESAMITVASHNQVSLEKALAEMRGATECQNLNKRIAFAQIYGMCDRLSFQLAEQGFEVYKSIPWGPVQDWIPYLARRASENFTAFRTSRNEIPFYKEEIKRRLLNRANI